MEPSLTSPRPLSRKGTWRTYTTAEGLAGLQTEHIAEDAEGYLWIGTWGSGVSRFDGDEFRTFTVKDGLPHNRVQAILLDRQGRLWLGTDGGVCWWDGKEFHRFDPGDGVSDKPISFLFEDQEGRLWFGGREALGYYDGSFHDLVPEYCHQHGQPPQTSREYEECQGIAQDREGHLWFAFSTNLVRYDGEYFHRYGEEHGLPPGRRTVGTDATGELWIGCGVNLYRYRDQTFQPVPIEVKALHIRKIQRDQEGRTWFCTTGEGVFCYDGAGFHYLTHQDGLAYDQVNAVFQDREGHFWFATFGGGLSCFDPSIQVLDGKEGLPFNTVTTLAADHQGRIWMGFGLWLGHKTSEVVSCYDGERLTTFGRQEGMDSCLTLYVDSRDCLWCGGLGLRQYEGERFQEIGREAGLERIGVSAFTEDQEGRLILGHWQEATSFQKIFESPLQLTRCDGQKFQTLLTREKAYGNTCIKALVAGRGQGIWFALGSSDNLDLGEGLGRWHETEGVAHYTIEDGLVDNRVTDLLEDRQGHLWITTSGGLSRFDGERFHNFTVAEGLPSNRVQCVCRDQQGHLWFGTDNGVVHYDGHTFQTIRSPQITSVNDLLQDRQGRFWFATLKGLVRYIPGRVPPRVRILQVVAGQVHEGSEEVTTFNQQIFFGYKGLSFRTHPKDMLYTCRLQGYEEEWQKPTREMRAFYQDLPVGDYTFQVRSIDRDLNYSEPASVRLKVIPDLRDERIDELEQRVRVRTRELEEQNRELFVERAVERVRAEAAAMKGSRDIGRLLLALYAGWRECGLRFDSGAINIVDEQAGWWQHYGLVPEGVVPQEGVLQAHVVEGLHLFRSPPVSLSWARERGWAQPGLEPAFWTGPETFPEDMRHVWGVDLPFAERWVGRSGIIAPFAYGSIFALAEEGYQFRQEDLEIVKRFAGAVSLGYTRFFDLQAAEERARQAARQAAVDRVRAEIATMRTAGDLERVTPLLWKELTGLGVPFFRCGVFIVDEAVQLVNAYLTNPQGAPLAALNLAFDSLPTISPMVHHWREQRVYVEQWDQQTFLERLRQLIAQGQPIQPERFLDAGAPPEALTVQFVPFTHGMLYVGSAAPLSEEDIALVKDLAAAFSVAYARYLDFQRLEAQNCALEEANAKIQEANRLKSQFLANMSHELRTPLNAIVGFSRIVHRKAQGLLPQRQVENIEKVLQSSEFLMSLINDILDLSKIEAGRLEIQPEWFSLRELIGGCTSTVSPMVKRGVELRTDLSPQLDRIHSDPSRVRQVLINLLSNAAKFTEKGSITVALQPAGEGRVELSVADSGIGIPAEAREFIFEEFRQVDGSTTRRYGGTGLGLSITKKLIEMLGGSIRVESQEGKGSTFIVTLPALGAPGPAPAPQTRDLAERTPEPGRRLILSIDDDPNVLSLLAQELEEEGYQVVGVTRALEGIEKARHSAPYAITLDIMMPGMDGWEAIAKLKGDPQTRDIPLIVVSIIDDRELGFRLGADEYLVKPIDKERLLRVLHRYEGRGQEVLVADDDPAVVELVRQLLEEFGWKVRGAADGQQALDQIARQKPDVLLLDLMMPVVDGFETLRQLRSDPQTRDLPVVVITAKDLTPQEREELLQSTSRIIAKDGMERERLLHELRESLKGLYQLLYLVS